MLGPTNAALPRAWLGDLLGLAGGLLWALTTLVVVLVALRFAPRSRPDAELIRPT